MQSETCRASGAFDSRRSSLPRYAHRSQPRSDCLCSLFVMRCDGPPELVIRRKHSVIPMPVLPRWRHEIREPVEELKRRQLDDAVGPRPRGRPRTAPADPVGGFVPWQHVADSSDAAGGAGDRGESLESEGGPGAIPQQMFETLEIARHVAVEERDPDTGID
jgi:hypothetical protein